MKGKWYKMCNQIIKSLRIRIRKLESDNDELRHLYNRALKQIELLKKVDKVPYDMPDFMKDIFKL
jgi:hypothetical protein